MPVDRCSTIVDFSFLRWSATSSLYLFCIFIDIIIFIRVGRLSKRRAWLILSRSSEGSTWCVWLFIISCILCSNSDEL